MPLNPVVSTAQLASLGVRWNDIAKGKRNAVLNLATFGDSITNFLMTYQQAMEMRSTQRITTAAIISYPGATSSDMVTHITDVTTLSPRPDYCLILIGTNDAVAGASVATFAANIETIVAAFEAKRIQPILCTVPPIDNATWTVTGERLSAWITMYARLNNYPLVDVRTPLINVTNGQYASGLGRPDGVHPTNQGLWIMGGAIADTLEPLLLPSIPYRQLAEGGENLFPNALQLIDTDANGLADGWSKQGGSAIPASITPTLTNHPDGGKWQVFTTNGTEAGTVNVIRASISSGFTAGDTLHFGMDMDITATDAANATVIVTIACYDNAFAVKGNISVFSMNSSPITLAGPLATSFVVPTGTTRMQLTIGIGKGVGVHKFAHPTMWNLTTLGLA